MRVKKSIGKPSHGHFTVKTIKTVVKDGTIMFHNRRTGEPGPAMRTRNFARASDSMALDGARWPNLWAREMAINAISGGTTV